MSDTAGETDGAVDAKVLLSVLARVKGGDFTARMPFDWTGVPGKVADGLNEVIAANQGIFEAFALSKPVSKEALLSMVARFVDAAA
jgi:hypothetical protein